MRQIAQLKRIYVLALLVVAIEEVLATTGAMPAAHDVFMDFLFHPSSFLTMGMFGAFIFHVLTRPRRSEILITAAIGLTLEILLAQLRGGFTQPLQGILRDSGGGLGVASLAMLALSFLRSPITERPHKAASLFVAGIIPLYVVLIHPFMDLTYVLKPKTYDYFLYAFDQTLGIQLSFLVGRVFERIYLLKVASMSLYLLLPAAIALLISLQFVREEGTPINMLAAFLVAGAAGYVLYYLYPAAGPLYRFGDAFPYSPPDAASLPMMPAYLPPAVRNAMPSLHTAWALILFWNSRNLNFGVRALMGILLVGILLAALGMGQHYAVDLVVAVPFAVAIQASCTTLIPTRDPRRFLAVAVGVVLTLIWLAFLRIAPQVHQISAFVSWTAVCSTIAVSLTLHWVLTNAVRVAYEAKREPALPAGTAMVMVELTEG